MGSAQMSKYDILSGVAEKIKALDNGVKLKILALLIEEGAKSITDISKELNINFSTAHKYLEQLEAAELVASKQVSENRLKRLFTIRDFDIKLSPKGLSELVNGKAAEEAKSSLRVINEKGELVDFSEKIFSQKYLKRGMPRSTIVSTIGTILSSAYDGITLLELRRMFKDALEKKVASINEVFKQVDASDRHKRTFAHLLGLVHPEALDMHARGDIFIRNLREPKLLNFVHDIRGIAVHGVAGKKPETLQDLFKQVLFAVNFSSSFTSGSQALDSINYFIAPLIKDYNETEFRQRFAEFLSEINNSKIKLFIGIDFGVPDFIHTLPVGYLTEKASNTYIAYKDLAEKLAKVIFSMITNSKHENINVVVKVWDKKYLDLLDFTSGTHIANMTVGWQKPNTSYADCVAHLNSGWRRWVGTNRAGEMQEIVVNLLKIALLSRSQKDFFANVEKTISLCCDFIENMAELATGEFLRKHKTQLPSTQTTQWSYVITEHAAYSISLTGVSTAIDLLKKKGVGVSDKKIFEACDAFLQKHVKAPIRILLKEGSDSIITNRFAHIDASTYPNIPKYYTGAGLTLKNASLQSYFWGGSCIKISKSQIKDLKKSEFGLVKVD